MVRTSAKSKVEFKQTDLGSGSYNTLGESITIEEKMKILEELGKPEMVDLFKDYQPRRRFRRKTAPLDQRISITVKSSERVMLTKEIESMKAKGEKISLSQLIRDRAVSNVDLHGWKEIAIRALNEISDAESNRKKYEKRKVELFALLDDTEDSEDEYAYQKEINSINQKLGRLTAVNSNRTGRLAGRATMAEAETIKWRAQRLCISASDYLRMMIYCMEPDSVADAHLSVDSKKRFYISIIDVANNGWGSPPTIFNCTQCGHYLEKIEILEDRIKQLETFL